MTQIQTHEDLVNALTATAVPLASDGVFDHKSVTWIPTRIIGGYIVDEMYRVNHGTEMVYESVSWSRAMEKYNNIELNNETT